MSAIKVHLFDVFAQLLHAANREAVSPEQTKAGLQAIEDSLFELFALSSQDFTPDDLYKTA